MKKLFLFLLILAAVSGGAQEKKPTLKELLYSGKLKKDSTGIIRSTDDLSSKVDTGTKKEPEVQPASKVAAVVVDSAKTVAIHAADSSVAAVAATEDIDTETTVTKSTAPSRSNTKIWKDYTDSLVKVLNAEVMPSRQIKKDTYYILLDYEIETNGAVTVVNVSSTPDNAFLKSRISQIVDSTPLLLNPTLDSSGQPRKVKRKQSFTVTKD